MLDIVYYHGNIIIKGEENEDCLSYLSKMRLLLDSKEVPSQGMPEMQKLSLGRNKGTQERCFKECQGVKTKKLTSLLFLFLNSWFPVQHLRTLRTLQGLLIFYLNVNAVNMAKMKLNSHILMQANIWIGILLQDPLENL
jgi:hypothetical protein